MSFTAEYRHQEVSEEYLRLNMYLYLLTKLSTLKKKTDMLNLYVEVLKLAIILL